MSDVDRYRALLQEILNADDEAWEGLEVAGIADCLDRSLTERIRATLAEPITTRRGYVAIKSVSTCCVELTRTVHESLECALRSHVSVFEVTYSTICQDEKEVPFTFCNFCQSKVNFSR